MRVQKKIIFELIRNLLCSFLHRIGDFLFQRKEVAVIIQFLTGNLVQLPNSQTSMSYLTSSNLISTNLRNRDNSSNQESSLGFPEHIPFSSMSLSLGTKSTTLGQSNLDSLGSALNHPRKFTTYAERMSTNLAFSDGTSLSVGSPKTKKTGAEMREELLNSLLSRTNTLSATEQRTLPYANGGVSQPPRIPSRPHTQQGSSFTLQLFQRTLEETLGAFQKSIHEDMRNLHIEILRQFHMQETRQAFTPEQINEACYVDINSNKAVFDSLRNNPKVNYDGRCFAYKSKHALKDKNQLLILIRKFPEGIAVIDLKDAYPTVMEDLQALKAAGQIWLLSNFDSQEDIAYPNDPRVPIKVDDDLKLLFRGIELPRDMIDIEKNLQKNGMKPATNTAKI
ncbi:uncharacterized protein LOC114263355 isoform X1 [Camellia sinensis]|uniref:uncharacterized protein LOC114263355 isoform X1 n=3 Tax=Camellia sinensis TaxID=4442 RepID=UPI0010357ABF|nr:uncharacterized protein LOC114263355 isoform X1 [Camellia sinensis]XP_028059663.1 uncharacterized protein LOC114263355 isoform X1 [Camellia sinensis]